MTVKNTFAQAVKAGKMWPTLLVMGAAVFLVTAVVAGGVFAYLSYNHTFSYRTEEDVYTGTKYYLRMLRGFLDKGHLTQAQFEQYKNNLTPYMADRCRYLLSSQLPEMEQLFERYHLAGEGEQAGLAVQVVEKISQILDSNVPLAGMEKRFEPVLYVNV